jgi:hypothetical protein
MENNGYNGKHVCQDANEELPADEAASRQSKLQDLEQKFLNSVSTVKSVASQQDIGRSTSALTSALSNGPAAVARPTNSSRFAEAAAPGARQSSQSLPSADVQEDFSRPQTRRSPMLPPSSSWSNTTFAAASRLAGMEASRLLLESQLSRMLQDENITRNPHRGFGLPTTRLPTGVWNGGIASAVFADPCRLRHGQWQHPASRAFNSVTSPFFGCAICRSRKRIGATKGGSQ